MFMHVIVKYFPYMSVFPNSLRRQGSFTEFCGFQNPGPCGRTTAAVLFSHSHRCCPLSSVSHQRINFCAAGAMEAAQPLQLFPSLRRQKACWSSPASQDFCPWHEKNEASFALSCGKRWIGYSEKRVRLQTFSIQFLFSEVWKSEGTCSLGLEKASFKNRRHHTANMLNTRVSIHVLDELGFCLCTLPSSDLHQGF